MLVLNQRSGFGSRRRGGATPFTTAWKFAGTGANDNSVGNSAWGSPGNVTASDNVRSSANLNQNETTQILRATNFGFTTGDIPSGATILGIEIGIERRGEDQPPPIQDHTIILRTSAGQTGNNKADTGTNWPSTDAEVIYGGAADMWGTSLSDSDLRGSDFGVDIRAKTTAGAGDSNSQVDAVRCRVHGEV